MVAPNYISKILLPSWMLESIWLEIRDFQRGFIRPCMYHVLSEWLESWVILLFDIKIRKSFSRISIWFLIDSDHWKYLIYGGLKLKDVTRYTEIVWGCSFRCIHQMNLICLSIKLGNSDHAKIVPLWKTLMSSYLDPWVDF